MSGFLSQQVYLLAKMSSLPRIVFTVSNDLNYDQRMHRIAGTLANSGYRVLLVGRRQRQSKPLSQTGFTCKRLSLFFSKGFFFYTEYNFRLFVFLLFQPADIFCAIDLDTILPVYFAGKIRGKKRVYDAHEWFTEQKEVISRPYIHRFWLAIEKFAVPRFPHGYTVNDHIRSAFRKRYQVEYAVVRNLPRLMALPEKKAGPEKWILYQGAVNEGRCFETLIPAMQKVPARLLICGGGNFFTQTRALIQQYRLADKIELKGYLSPQELAALTPHAHIGITLFEREGMNQYYSLANRFFDYMMAGVPQVCVNYPEYAAINRQYGFACMIDNTDADSIALWLNNLLNDDVLYAKLRQNCLEARAQLNWENETAGLTDFYKALV